MILKKYTSSWIKDFDDIKREIEIALDGLEYFIEHVGSTSVPNLDSKPIIDIDIIYAAEPDFDHIKSRLERIGYAHHGNQGVEGREVFKRNDKLANAILDTVKHHLYVCPSSSNALERHLLSRDRLRKDNTARIKYQQMKYALAEKANQDRKVYAVLKELTINDFIDSIVAEERQASNMSINKL